MGIFDRAGAALRQWNIDRARAKAIAAAQQRGMKRDWWSATVGLNNSTFAGGGMSRLTASLAQWSGSANADLDGTLTIMRARARQMANNNEFARRFLSMVATNVIGHAGPVLQVRAKTTNGSLDKAANDAVELRWVAWGDTADAGGRMTLSQLQRVAVKAVARDGEALIRIVRDRRLPGGIQLQLLESDRLDERINQRLDNGNAVRMGVEVDSMLRPVAYYIRSRHPGEMSVVGGQTVTERVDARDVYHLYLPERAEQVRGYTWFHAVLMRIAMLHGYEEAAVVAARVGAAKMGVFQRTAEAADSLNQVADSTSDGTATGTLQMNAEAGEFFELPPGYTLESWDPEYPHANFESFIKQCMRGVAAGLDVATHNLSGDMTDVNYSSARIAELSEREQWCVLQDWWISSFLLPFYRTDWLPTALLRGDIVFESSGKALPADRLDKFATASKFQGRRWQWVDPSKEIEAAERAIVSGLQSRTQLAASQGREFEDIVDELKAERLALEAAGLPTQPGKVPGPSADPTGGTAAPVAGKTLDIEAVLRAVSERAQPAPTINVDARSTINVPEREVHLEANLPAAAAPVVNIEPAPVTVMRSEAPVVHVASPEVHIDNNVRVEQPPLEVNVNLPVRKSDSTIERNLAGEITRVTQVERDA